MKRVFLFLLLIFFLLREFQKRKLHMALVVDEFGGISGLVTIEDLLEEIFGELEDEFDQEMPEMYYYDSQGRTHLRGDLLITDVNEYLELNLPEDEIDTLGGLVFSLLGRPPHVGDEVDVGGLTIRVEKVADQSVAELSFKLPDSAPVPQIEEWEVAPHD
jgi:CBS domain containing-hemolysin-like protein